MKKLKRAAGTVVFLSIAIVLLTAASYLVRPEDGELRISRLRGFYAEPKESIDVVFTGSSATYRFINPLQLWENYGFTAYAMSAPSQPVAVMKYLIDEAERTQSPQLYVVECRRLFAGGSVAGQAQIRWTADAMPYSVNRFKAVREMTKEYEDPLPYYLDIIKYHDNWEQINKESIKRLAEGLKLDGKGWYNHNGWKEGLSRPKLVSEDEKLPIIEFQENQLRELIAKCKSEGKEVLFLLTPYKISGEDQKKANYVREIVEEGGYRFLDCNRYYDEIGIDFGVDYYDWKHTNTLGAEKVTRFIGNYIMENYSLETEYNDKITADWNEAAAAAHKGYEEAKETILTKAGVNN